LTATDSYIAQDKNKPVETSSMKKRATWIN